MFCIPVEDSPNESSCAIEYVYSKPGCPPSEGNLQLGTRSEGVRHTRSDCHCSVDCCGLLCLKRCVATVGREKDLPHLSGRRFLERESQGEGLARSELDAATITTGKLREHAHAQPALRRLSCLAWLQGTRRERNDPSLVQRDLVNFVFAKPFDSEAEFLNQRYSGFVKLYQEGGRVLPRSNEADSAPSASIVLWNLYRQSSL